MTELSAVEKTERWMHEHPRTSILVLASFLVVIGIIIGIGLTTNIYNDEWIRIFTEAAETHHPLPFNNRLYSIQDLGEPEPGDFFGNSTCGQSRI